MTTHRTDVSVRFGVPDLPETQVRTAEAPFVRVPDVRMHSEASAIAMIASSGLVPGLRSPWPRPVSGVSEVVVRTFPRRSTLVARGSRVDYELLPGDPSRATPRSDAHRGGIGSLERPGDRPAEERV